MPFAKVSAAWTSSKAATSRSIPDTLRTSVTGCKGLAADLVRRQAALIYVTDNPSALAAKAATATIPIVFRIGADPIQLGLVASLNRPGGNMTGVSFLVTTTGASRLQMLHDAVPNAVQIGLLVNPANPYAELDTREAQEATQKLGLKLLVVNATNEEEIGAAICQAGAARRAGARD